jgi:acyl carrier protein
MAPAEINRKLTGIFRDVLDNDALVLRPDLTADQVQGWDSLAHIRLILSVQKAFGIKFSTAEIGKIKNAGELEALLQNKLGSAA